VAITIDWATKIISVPQSDLILISGNKYYLDVDTFRLALKDLEDSEEGMAFPMTHNHNSVVVLSGVSYARVVEIINGYTVSFEDTGTPYSVRLQGANNNIFDVTNVIANVSVIVTNSAGLIETGGGSSNPWSALLGANNTAGTFGERVQKLLTTAKFLGTK
jgi:hypothetical protein